MLSLSRFSSLFFSRSLPSRCTPLSERLEQATKFGSDSFKTNEDIAPQNGENLLTFVWWKGTNFPPPLQHTSGDGFSLTGPRQKLKKLVEGSI